MVCISSNVLVLGNADSESVSYKLEICYLCLIANAILAISITSTSISFSVFLTLFHSLTSNSSHIVLSDIFGFYGTSAFTLDIDDPIFYNFKLSLSIVPNKSFKQMYVLIE